MVVLLLFVGFGAFMYYTIREYKKGFVDNVVKPIISKCSSDLEYNADKGFSVDDYKSLNFLERFNVIKSYNQIINVKNNIVSAELEVINDGSDNEGDYVVSTLYHGVLATSNVKNINSRILIGDTRELLNLTDDTRPVQTNDEVFNKLYSISSNNTALASALMSSDVINCLVNLKKNLLCDIDIRIINDKIYVRYNTFYSIKPYLFYDKFEVHNILCYLIVLDEVMKTMCLIKNKIENMNIGL